MTTAAFTLTTKWFWLEQVWKLVINHNFDETPYREWVRENRVKEPSSADANDGELNERGKAIYY